MMSARCGMTCQQNQAFLKARVRATYLWMRIHALMWVLLILDCQVGTLVSLKFLKL